MADGEEILRLVCGVFLLAHMECGMAGEGRWDRVDGCCGYSLCSLSERRACYGALAVG